MWFHPTRLLLAGLFVGSVMPAAAQVTKGGSAVPFLLISPSARNSGMGESGTGVADDINATFFNIGGLGYQKNTQVSLTYSKWLPQFNADLHYSYLNGATYVEDLAGTVSGQFTYLDLGEFQQTFDDGTQGKKFRSLEFAVALGYSTMLSEDLGAGIMGRYIQSNLSSIPTGPSNEEGIGRSVGFDLGVLWKPATDLGLPKDFLNLGLAITNIGPKIHYIDIKQADPLPTSFRLGTSLHVVEDEYNDLRLTADIMKLLVNRPSKDEVDPVPKSLVTAWGNGNGVELAMGAEYWYEKLVALRAGYFTESAASGNREFLTFGAGIRYDMYGLDFSYINTIEESHPLANTLRFSLVVDFDHSNATK